MRKHNDPTARRVAQIAASGGNKLPLTKVKPADAPKPATTHAEGVTPAPLKRERVAEPPTNPTEFNRRSPVVVTREISTQEAPKMTKNTNANTKTVRTNKTVATAEVRYESPKQNTSYTDAELLKIAPNKLSGEAFKRRMAIAKGKAATTPPSAPVVAREERKAPAPKAAAPVVERKQADKPLKGFAPVLPFDLNDEQIKWFGERGVNHTSVDFCAGAVIGYELGKRVGQQIAAAKAEPAPKAEAPKTEAPKSGKRASKATETAPVVSTSDAPKNLNPEAPTSKLRVYTGTDGNVFVATNKGWRLVVEAVGGDITKSRWVGQDAIQVRVGENNVTFAITKFA